MYVHRTHKALAMYLVHHTACSMYGMGTSGFIAVRAVYVHTLVLCTYAQQSNCVDLPHCDRKYYVQTSETCIILQKVHANSGRKLINV